MADITIIRNGARISLASFPKIGSGSENITVAVNGSGEYSTYTTELYYGFYVGGVMQRMLAKYSNGIYTIPANALFNAGNFYLTVRLVSGNNKVSTNTIPVTIEKSAVNNAYSILPASETWQSAVDKYINNSNSLLNKRIDNLVANTGDSNSEIVDARLGADNFTYSALGTAIRTQFENVNNVLSIAYFKPKVGAYLWCDRVYSGVTKSNDSNTCWSETPILCKKGSTIHCKCQGKNNACITTSSKNDITTAKARVISMDDTQMVEYTYTLDNDMYVWVSSRTKELIAWVEQGNIEELSDKAKKANPFFIEVRDGSALNPTNTTAVASKYIIPRMGFDGFKLFTSRPNKKGCIYKYGFATYSINPDAFTLASLKNGQDYQTYFQNYTLDSNECYFKDTTSKGMTISIVEYNTTSNEYVPLRADDFKDHYVYVAPIENKNSEYLKNEIDEKSDLVLGKETHDSFSFIFATDFHKTNDKLNNNAIGNCLKAIEDVSNNINSSFVCYGGDYIDTPTKNDGLKDLRYFGKSRNNRPFYKLIGNHDSNPYSVDGTSGAISTNEIYVRLNKNNNYIKVDAKQPYNNYGYYDDEMNKVRYICLNTSDSPTSDGFGMTDRQFSWFAETLIDVGAKDGWCIIVLSHRKLSYLNLIMQAYHDGIEKTIDGTSYNFSTGNKSPIVAFIYGHVHADKSEYFVENSKTLNILGIATTCSAPYDIKRSQGDDGVVHNAIPATKDETSFSIFTIDKTNKKIYETKYGNGMQNREWNWSY